MMLTDNFQFLHPWFLLLLLLIPVLVLWYLWRFSRRYPTINIPGLSEHQNLHSWKGRLRALLPIFRGLAFMSIVIALARPQSILKQEDIDAEGIDIAMVMDLSSSMLAQDFQPDRLEVSKRVAAEFVDKREFDRIALSVFAGEAFTQCPLTTDHNIVKMFLSDLQCGLLQDGTAIGMGLATSINRLKESEAKSKVIILLTDGVNNAGYIKPITATEIAKKLGIKVYTIGVGSTGEALTPVSRRPNGQYVFGLAPVEIDELLLQQIAEATGGKYFRATSAESLAKIYAEIDQLEKTKMEITTITRYSEEFHTFAWWGMFFLILELMLRYSILRAIP